MPIIRGSSEGFDFCRRNVQPLGECVERLLLDSVDLALLDPGDGLGRDTGSEILSAQAALFPQAPERGSEGLFRRLPLFLEATPKVRVELIEDRVGGRLVIT